MTKPATVLGRGGDSHSCARKAEKAISMSRLGPLRNRILMCYFWGALSPSPFFAIEQGLYHTLRDEELV